MVSRKTRSLLWRTGIVRPGFQGYTFPSFLRSRSSISGRKEATQICRLAEQLARVIFTSTAAIAVDTRIGEISLGVGWAVGHRLRRSRPITGSLRAIN